LDRINVAIWKVAQEKQAPHKFIWYLFLSREAAADCSLGRQPKEMDATNRRAAKRRQMHLRKRVLVSLSRMVAHLSPLRGLMNLPFRVPWADAQGYSLLPLRG
jgi:hypothetical protein